MRGGVTMGCCGGGHNHRVNNDSTQNSNSDEHGSNGFDFMSIFMMIAVIGVAIYFLR